MTMQNVNIRKLTPQTLSAQTEAEDWRRTGRCTRLVNQVAAHADVPTEVSANNIAARYAQ